MITENELIELLINIGLKKGDTVLVHSDLRGFGLPNHAGTREEILKFYYDCILSVIGHEGTIAVPAYFYEYARQQIPFDADKSPVSDSLGSFSQWVTSHPQAIRSCNPLQSIAAIGKNAHELTGSLSLSGYGIQSPWHKLRMMGGKILFLGAPIQSMTFVHYIEQQYGVPHLYFKIFPYPVFKGGKQLPGHPISAVRYLDYSINYNLSLFQVKMEEEGVLLKSTFKSLTCYAVTAENAYRVGIAGLDQNPYFFLQAPPLFIPGKIPTDIIRS